MGWSTGFAAKAKAYNKSPVYLLDSVLPVGWDGDDVHFSSAQRAGYSAVIVPSACMVTWGRVSPPSWQSSASSCRIACLPTAGLIGVQRGTILQLSVDLGGTIEPVFTGALVNWGSSYRGEHMVIELVGLEGALWGRMPLPGVNTAPFSGGTVGAGTLAKAYVAGDSDVDISGGSQPHFTAAGKAVIQIGTGANAIYISGTGWSVGTGAGGSDQLTGCSSSGVYDSSLANKSLGSAVAGVVYDEGHPIDLLSYCLDWQSLTTWPEGWKIGWPAGVYDRGESNAQVSAWGLGAANAGIKLYVDSSPVTFGDVLYPLLSDTGCVIVQRHGLVCGRVIRDRAALDGETVTDADIIDADWKAWADHPAGYQHEVYDRGGRPQAPLYSSDAEDNYAMIANLLRALGKRVPDIAPSGIFLAGNGTTLAVAGGRMWANPNVLQYKRTIPAFNEPSGASSSWRTDVVVRLAGYVLDRPEVCTVTLPGWRSEAIGDGIRIDSGIIRSRYPASGSWGGEVGLIVGGGPDLFGNTTTYEVLSVPVGATT